MAASYLGAFVGVAVGASSGICPTIGIADRLGYQRVLSISPLDENIVQQMPAPRPRVHPRDLLPRRKADESVGQQETVFRKRAQKKEAVIVTATVTLVSKRRCQQGVQVLVEFVLHRIRARHWGSVGGDDGGELVSPEW
ncbi:unnamed protein product [Schistocephalus solidus]|uniref:Secreted protein n=1 Tax=Schistocephalus solidus TaxID=70667 RepID=A0A183SUH5_SCHSO|nr:unnamed protein product [Schistocephalus solidus]